MKKYVILTAALNGALFTKTLDEKGQPKKDKNGNEYGYIRVENPATIDLNFSYNNGGVKRGQSALHNMSVAAWEKSKDFYSAGMQIPGRVKVVESLEAFPGSAPKTAGEGGTPCLKGGKQIYRGTIFVPLGAKDKNGVLISDEDELIMHDNVIAGSTVTTKSTEAVN